MSCPVGQVSVTTLFWELVPDASVVWPLTQVPVPPLS
jgi:hypothetical protein